MLSHRLTDGLKEKAVGSVKKNDEFFKDLFFVFFMIKNQKRGYLFLLLWT